MTAEEDNQQGGDERERRQACAWMCFTAGEKHADGSRAFSASIPSVTLVTAQHKSQIQRINTHEHFCHINTDKGGISSGSHTHL